QSSEIYGGINGFWDYGPLGAELKRNLKNAWWHDIIRCPPLGPDNRPIRTVALDTTIIMHPKVWEASGHVGGFADPMQTCRQCKNLFRADHVTELLEQSSWLENLSNVIDDRENESLGASIQFEAWAKKKGAKLAPGLAFVRGVHQIADAEVIELARER